jgi:hypothetical protein
MNTPRATPRPVDLKAISGLTPAKIIAKLRPEELCRIGELDLSEVAMCIRGGKNGTGRVSVAELETLLNGFGVTWRGSTWEKEHLASGFLQAFLPIRVSD